MKADRRNTMKFHKSRFGVARADDRSIELGYQLRATGEYDAVRRLTLRLKPARKRARASD
jgi:hypothetical protein